MSKVTLSIGSVVLRQPAGMSQDPLAIQRSLEAALNRGMAGARVGKFKDANVLRARLPSASASPNAGAAISGAIVRALKKGR